jgi:type IV secretory pathway TrbL component
VDFVVPTKGGGLQLIEAKAGGTARPEAAAAMLRLRDAIAKSGRRGKVAMTIAYEPAKPGALVVADGVRAVGWRDLFAS